MSLYTIRKQICVYGKTTAGAFGSTTSTPNESNVLSASNVIEVYTPVETPTLQQTDRNPSRPRTGMISSVPGTFSRQITFTAEWKSSGTPGTAPKIAPLLKACGLTETTNTGSAAIGTVYPDLKTPATEAAKPAVAGTFGGTVSGRIRIVVTAVVTDTSVTFDAYFYPNTGAAATVYAGESQTSGTAVSLSGGALDGVTVDFGDPSSSTSGIVAGAVYSAALTSDQEKSVSYAPSEKSSYRIDIALNEDGRIKKIQNCMGTYSLKATNGEYGTVEFTFTGVDAGEASDASLYSDYLVDDIVPSAVLSCSPTLGGTALQPWTEFTFDAGNNVQLIEDATSSKGFQGAEIIGRNPVGTINPLATLFATENQFTTLRSGATAAFALSYGATGNVYTFNAQAAQKSNVGTGDANGLLRETINLSFRQPDYDAGGDYTDYMHTFS